MSICKSLVDTHDDCLKYTNQSQTTIVSSSLLPQDNTISAFSFPWIAEMRSRSATIDFLVRHEITDMFDTTNTNSWPSLDLAKEELVWRLTEFKRNAFLLLYKLTDCVVSDRLDFSFVS